jgi:hypothetical protein
MLQLSGTADIIGSKTGLWFVDLYKTRSFHETIFPVSHPNESALDQKGVELISCLSVRSVLKNGAKLKD